MTALLRQLGDAPQQFHAVHARHLQVGDHDRRRPGLDLLQRLNSVARGFASEAPREASSAKPVRSFSSSSTMSTFSWFINSVLLHYSGSELFRQPRAEPPASAAEFIASKDGIGYPARPGSEYLLHRCAFPAGRDLRRFFHRSPLSVLDLAGKERRAKIAGCMLTQSLRIAS